MTITSARRRQQVIKLRIRLERVAVGAYTAVCNPRRTPRASGIETRLLFLVGVVDADEQPEVHRLAHLGGHVYRRTSDVMHGRTNALDLSDVVLDEWRTVVEDLEATLRPVATTASSGY